jgi:4-amino-4-deoxy-L-arabinose transferase
MALGLWNLLSRENRHRYFQLATAGAVLLLGLALLGFLYVQFSLALGFPLYSQAWQVLVAVLGLIFFIALCIWARKSRSVMNKVLLFALAPLLLFSTAHLLLPDRTLDVRAPGRLLARYGQHFGPDTIIISDKDSIGAVCWFLHRSDVYVVGNAGELGYGFSYPDAAGRRLDLQAVVDLIHRHRGKLVLVARRKHFDKWRNLLPKPESEVGSGPKGYVICRY